MTRLLPRFVLPLIVACGGGAPPVGDEVPDRDAPPGGETAAPFTDQLPNAVAVDDQLVIGGQPDDAALRQARDEGFRTVVSLRTPGEPGSAAARATVEGLGMRFVSIPVDRDTGLTEQNARALDEALTDPEAGRTVVYCGSGNRAAALLGLRAFVVEGASMDVALARFRELGLPRLEDKLRAAMAAICEAEPDRDC
jgi:uncharacterized protein (TIGR01244 family)